MGYRNGLGAVLLAAAAAAPLTAAADDLFLRLEDIRGESTDARHRGEIDIQSYSQGLSGPYAHSTPGTPGAAGKTVCSPVSVTKYVDRSSPDLLLSAANGKHFPRAVITFRRPGGPNQLEYYKVTLDDVVIVSLAQSGSSGSGRTMETVSLLGRRFRFEYTSQTPDGKLGDTPKSGWDCVDQRQL